MTSEIMRILHRMEILSITFSGAGVHSEVSSMIMFARGLPEVVQYAKERKQAGKDRLDIDAITTIYRMVREDFQEQMLRYGGT